MDDILVVSIPTRAWAVGAIADLAAEGVRAELLDVRDCRGHCQIRISGARESLEIIRRELHVPEKRVCWESFVNGSIAG